ncbi:MAG: bifunctional folylpolyglutamate synthase/dihydrofolate synthase [Acidimicrobiia bacterium]
MIRDWLAGHLDMETGVGVPVGAPTPPERALEQFAQLCALLGDPQDQFPAALIAGTVGKTSTSMLTSALLAGTGLSIGTYTSPHLVRSNERIRWNGEAISDAALDDVLSRVAAVEAFLPGPPSWFEIMTAVAFQYFADIAVEIGVVEVGLGGKWDATRVARTEVVAMTNIGIDHTEYFGTTLEAIAAAEAEVITPDAAVVCGETDADLLDVLRNRPHGDWWQFGEQFDLVDDQIAVGGRMLHVVTPEADYPELFVSLHGPHQGRNVAVALATAEAMLGRPVEAEIVTEVLGHARVPGRLEVVQQQPLVVIDGAHNLPGATALAEALDETFMFDQRVIVVGLLREKDPDEMLEALGVGPDDVVICTRPATPRAHEPEVVAAAAERLEAKEVEVIEDPVRAVRYAVEGADDDALVVVTGSLYLIGAVRPALISGLI